MNKTELTKRKILGYNPEFEDGHLIGISFTTSHTIKKLKPLFQTYKDWYQCFDKDDVWNKCYIMCKLSSDFKQIDSITYVIELFDDDYMCWHKKEINGYDVFNNEEITLIKDEVNKIFDNLRWLMFAVNLRKMRISKTGRVKF